MSKQLVQMLLLTALAMSVGWGWRGDYGHEAGAMVPGALLGLAICLAAGREDWLKRGSLLATLGAVGWSFGGQMSYGIVIGYTAASSFADVLYGYTGLFAIGALWGGIGAGVLAFGITEARSTMERLAEPVVAFYLALLSVTHSGITDWLSNSWSLYDTDWVAATLALLVATTYAVIRPQARMACVLMGMLAAGWWLGLLLLTILMHLRMTPPRSDNWAGCVGLWIAFAVYLYRTKRRVALRLSLIGLLSGGIGFAVADWVNMLGRAKWGFIGSSETLSALDSWKWMEQLFGFIMGGGVAWGFARAAQTVTPPEEDVTPGKLHWLSLLFLLLAIPWENWPRNVQTWTEANLLSEGLFGVAPQRVILLVAILLSLLVAFVIWHYHHTGLALVSQAALGRTQMLFLLILWSALVVDFTRALPNLKARDVLFVHLTFWLTALLVTFLVFVLRHARDTVLSYDVAWRLNWKFAVVWAVMPLLLFALARFSVSMHNEPLPGSRLRFATVTTAPD